MREKALSKRAFARETGFGQRKVTEIWSEPSFPVVAGKVFWSDFVLWRRRNLPPQRCASAPDEQPRVDRTPCAPAQMSDSHVSLRPRAARLAALAASLF